MDFNELERQLTESEMALFIGVTMAMFSAVETGASQQGLLERLSLHGNNFTARRQAKAALIMDGLKAMVQSTIPK